MLNIFTVGPARLIFVVKLCRAVLHHLDAVHIEVAKVERATLVLAANKVVVVDYSQDDQVGQCASENFVQRNFSETDSHCQYDLETHVVEGSRMF